MTQWRAHSSISIHSLPPDFTNSVCARPLFILCNIVGSEGLWYQKGKDLTPRESSTICSKVMVYMESAPVLSSTCYLRWAELNADAHSSTSTSLYSNVTAPECTSYLRSRTLPTLRQGPILPTIRRNHMGVLDVSTGVSGISNDMERSFQHAYPRPPRTWDFLSSPSGNADQFALPGCCSR